MTPNDAATLAALVRHWSDREDILDDLVAAFPDHDWRDLVLVTCPNCQRRVDHLFSPRWCYHCRPEDQRPQGISLAEFDRAARNAFDAKKFDHLFSASPLLGMLKRR